MRRLRGAGDKLNFPRKGSNIKVTYVGRLANADGTEGEEFDSTYNARARPPTHAAANARFAAPCRAMP
jgi:hypothetical protein